jgi:hypothetical protein
MRHGDSHDDASAPLGRAGHESEPYDQPERGVRYEPGAVSDPWAGVDEAPTAQPIGEPAIGRWPRPEPSPWPGPNPWPELAPEQPPVQEEAPVQEEPQVQDEPQAREEPQVRDEPQVLDEPDVVAVEAGAADPTQELRFNGPPPLPPIPELPEPLDPAEAVRRHLRPPRRGPLRRFTLYASGADTRVLHFAPVDESEFIVQGSLVILTAIVAGVSGLAAASFLTAGRFVLTSC